MFYIILKETVIYFKNYVELTERIIAFIETFSWEDVQIKLILHNNSAEHIIALRGLCTLKDNASRKKFIENAVIGLYKYSPLAIKEVTIIVESALLTK